MPADPTALTLAYYAANADRFVADAADIEFSCMQERVLRLLGQAGEMGLKSVGGASLVDDDQLPVREQILGRQVREPLLEPLKREVTTQGNQQP